MENLSEGNKIVLFKNKRSLNLHKKCGALSQTSLPLNYRKISSLSPKHWGSSYPESST